MALETSPENPAPLRVINAAIADWVSRLGQVWVEGQVTQITARAGMSQAFIELRDVDQNLSARLVTSPAVMSSLSPALKEGDRIVAHVKAQYWTNRGQLVLRAADIRAVGIGDLLARIERLKQALHREGLFAPERKKPLPFLPTTVGLICGRDSAAQRDVVENATRRWPGINFEIRQVAVQGPEAAVAVTEALVALDRIEDVHVIVIARGGGSAEDLLAFSDEELLRAVAAATTPIVSAIGHEQDAPLLDYVADVRAPTPTDAARHVVPDVNEQLEAIEFLRQRAYRNITSLIDNQAHLVARLSDHPVLTDPSGTIDAAHDTISEFARRSATSLAHQLQLASTTVAHQRTALRAYSPAATIERGYAIVLDSDRTIVRTTDQVSIDQDLTIRVSDGEIGVVVAVENHKGSDE